MTPPLQLRAGGGRVGSRAVSAFTLLEMLVVIGVIAAVAVTLFSGLLGSGKGASLQSGQALVANLVAAARTQAAATGHRARVLVHADPGVPERYLRRLVLQVGADSGANPAGWRTLQVVVLPPGVFVVPESLAGLVDHPAQWRRTSDTSAELDSDVFTNQVLLYTPDGETTAQRWTGVAFTPQGTLTALAGGPPPRGSLLLALGDVRAPGTYAPGQPPVRLAEPPAVRGLMLSAYGVPALLDDRSAF